MMKGMDMTGIVAGLIFAALVNAQSFQGGLRGRVTDGRGVFAGVNLELREASTNAVLSTTTNPLSEYGFSALKPPTYTLGVTSTGFKKFERAGVVVETQGFPRLQRPFRLPTKCG
jgi:hypothetical protein